MAKEYLDKDGLLYFWQKIKNTFARVSHTHTKSQITDFPTIPSASSTTPKMNGTAAVGSESTFARGDHVHPSDTSRVPTTRKVNDKALSADITLDGEDIIVGGNSQFASDDIATAIETLDGAFDNKVDKVTGKGLSTNDYTTAEKTKLEGIASGAEVNVQSDWNVTDSTSDAFIKNKPTIPSLKNVFGKVKVGTTTIEADSTQDTLELVAGSNVTLTPDTTNDKVTIEATDTTYSDFVGCTTAEDGVRGLVPAPSKISGSAYTNQGYFLSASGLWVKAQLAFEADYSGKMRGSFKAGQYAISTTIPAATTDANGVMSAADKTKLDKLLFDSNNLIDSSILPSYVDDVIEAYARSGQTALSQNWLATGSASGTVITPETGKIYVLMADSGDYAANTQFRWSGTAYVKLADGGVSSITNAEIDTIVAS